MTVVLGPGWPGVLLHEAVGHGLEGDFNRKEVSAFSGRIGQRVASPLVTVVDDGTMPNRRGSLNCDDEGTPTSRTVLIENGILRGYLQDRLNARLMGLPTTGNGRRESFAHMPMPRMTNTFMLPGVAPPRIVRSDSSSLYASYYGGGPVDITNGKFVFSASGVSDRGDSKITRPVKGATLIGNGPDCAHQDGRQRSAADAGIGTCGRTASRSRSVSACRRCASTASPWAAPPQATGATKDVAAFVLGKRRGRRDGCGRRRR
jgi:TldD protein